MIERQTGWLKGPRFTRRSRTTSAGPEMAACMMGVRPSHQALTPFESGIFPTRREDRLRLGHPRHQPAAVVAQFGVDHDDHAAGVQRPCDRRDPPLPDRPPDVWLRLA